MTDLHWMAAAAAARDIAARKLSPVELMNALLERIGRLDPKLNVLIRLEAARSWPRQAGTAQSAPAPRRSNPSGSAWSSSQFRPSGHASLGSLGAPARATQAASPLLFGLLMDRMGIGVLAISAGLSLSAFFALLILRARTSIPQKVVFYGVPTVRIHLPPGARQLRTRSVRH